MADILAKIGVVLLTKLITETFLARVLVYTLETWAKQTDNKLDDRVVKAMADALGVPAEKLTDVPVQT